MTTPAATPTVPDDVYEQFQAIDKALASAVACLALGHIREMLEKLTRAQELSHSLNFKLDSERLPPGSVKPTSTLYTTAPEPEQAVLL